MECPAWVCTLSSAQRLGIVMMRVDVTGGAEIDGPDSDGPRKQWWTMDIDGPQLRTVKWIKSY